MNTKLQLSLSDKALREYITRLIQHHLPDGQENHIPEDTWFHSLERLASCFANIHLKYFCNSQGPCFNHLHGDHMAMLLYLLSNQAYRDKNINLAEKVFYLNKIMHSIDAFYSIELPQVFLFVHPLGTVLGHARYGNYFATYQQVTVGSDIDGVYPSFGEGTVLYSGASVIGSVVTEGNTFFAANSFLRKERIPKNKLVVNCYPSHHVKESRGSVVNDVFSRSH